jgi:hypothetical protein
LRIHRDIPQGTSAWDLLRIGKATASCFADVMARGQGKTRAAYLRKVVAETITGKPSESYRNSHMDRGKEQEPLARMAYELATDNIVEQVAFIDHDTLRAGCSPDGLVMDQPRGAEIKCVIPTVQVETILAGGYPSEHRAQIQGSLWITGFEEWDFCSYSPDMPAHLRTYIFTVQRDHEYIANLEAEVIRFLKDVEQTLSRLNDQIVRDSLKEAA